MITIIFIVIIIITTTTVTPIIIKKDDNNNVNNDTDNNNNNSIKNNNNYNIGHFWTSDNSAWASINLNWPDFEVSWATCQKHVVGMPIDGGHGWTDWLLDVLAHPPVDMLKNIRRNRLNMW